MAKEEKEPVKTVESFPNYTATTFDESKRFFLSKTVKVDGHDETKSFPVNLNRHNLILQHACGDIVTFKTYQARGKMRYKDSRFKVSEMLPYKAIEAVMGMLQVDEDKARQLLKVREVEVLI